MNSSACLESGVFANLDDLVEMPAALLLLTSTLPQLLPVLSTAPPPPLGSAEDIWLLSNFELEVIPLFDSNITFFFEVEIGLLLESGLETNNPADQLALRLTLSKLRSFRGATSAGGTTVPDSAAAAKGTAS